MKQSLPYWAVSGFIVVILGLQAYATTFTAYLKSWPLISYPMYSSAHYDGERLDHAYDTYAVLDNLDEVKIAPDDVHMMFWAFHNKIFLTLRKQKVEELAPVINDLCEKYDDRVIALTVRDLGIAISRDGPVEGLPPAEFGRVNVTCDGDVPK